MTMSKRDSVIFHCTNLQQAEAASYHIQSRHYMLLHSENDARRPTSWHVLKTSENPGLLLTACGMCKERVPVLKSFYSKSWLCKTPWWC